jgi:hypothetical protein
MFRKLLLAFAFLIPVSLAAAQSENDQPPPLLDAPDHWQVHDANGAMDLRMDVMFLCSVNGEDYYDIAVTGTINGQPYSSWAIAIDRGTGEVLDVYNGDSETWTEWHWNGDHYDKVGGTPNRRSYYPVY